VRRRALLALGLALLGLAGVVTARALLARPQPRAGAPAPPLELDARRVCERLGAAVRVRSIASADPDPVEAAALERMMDFVLERFASLRTWCELERHEACLVVRWPGTDPGLAPLLLLAHLDVVPVDPAGEGDWSFPPFSGEVAAGAVWGRGTLDDKAGALAILEALEHLGARGFRPRRGVVVALGLDEEVGGERGARAQAERFAAEGLSPFLVLDEGYGVLEGLVPPVAAPVAAIGVAEKGQLTVELEVRAEGGHASMPAPETALGVLAAALSRLEAEPAPARLDGVPAAFFDALAGEMEPLERTLFSNRWLLEPLLRAALLEAPSTAALLRTTTAVTRAEAGTADNALPRRASATVDLRLHPRDTVEGALARVARVVDDARVAVRALPGARPATPASPTSGAPWELLSRTVRECFPDAVVAPALCVAATDARHYQGLSDAVYRFNGLRLTADDLPRIHGADERIRTGDYLAMIRFYARLVENASR
jgi:carboxypeptidase PM20D1